MHKCSTVAVNLQQKNKHMHAFEHTVAIVYITYDYPEYMYIVASDVIVVPYICVRVQCVKSETKHKNSIYLLFLGSFHGVCQTLFGL